MGCDGLGIGRVRLRGDFNPRIPYGMRLAASELWNIAPVFQSTHPVWDATGLRRAVRRACRNFNPRIPYGMRLVVVEA